MSSRTAWAMPGRWIFTTARRPDFNSTRYTWARDAVPTGSVSTWRKKRRQRSPSSASSSGSKPENGVGVTRSWSCSNSAIM